MCFIISKNRPKSRIAKRNIKVLKYLTPSNTTKIMISSIIGYKYYEGLQLTIILKPSVIQDYYAHHYKTKEFIINEGYHSYHISHDIANLCRICYIPKGAEYYYNPNTKEYVSNQIIITFKLNDKYQYKIYKAHLFGLIQSLT